MDSSFVAFWNAELPMEVNPLGSVTDLRDEQLQKADEPIVIPLMLFSNTTSSIAEPEKALLPTEVTCPGITIFFRVLLLANMLAGISVIFSGIVNSEVVLPIGQMCITPVFLIKSRPSFPLAYTGLFSDTNILCRYVAQQKVSAGMVVTFSGMNTSATGCLQPQLLLVP